MKKLLGISLVAVLTATPLMASAAVTDADPGVTVPTAPAADNAPKYGLAAAGANDANVATAGYVKGAYNAAIKAVNRVKEDSATKTGVVKTIKDVTLTSTFTGENVTGNVSSTFTGNAAAGTVASTFSNGAVTGSATGDVSSTFTGNAAKGSVSSQFSNGTVTGTVSVPANVASLTTWGDDTSVGSVPLTGSQSVSIEGGTVTGDVTSTFTGEAVTGTVASTFSNGSITGSATGDITSTFTGEAVTGTVASTFTGNAAAGTVTTTINQPSVVYTDVVQGQ